MRKDLLRPTRLEDYIGQEHLKDLLRTSILAASRREEPLDHVLLSGPPGLGKTTLANIIANEMSWKIKTIIGPSLGNPGAVVHLVTGLKPKTMIFIDEVHRLRKPVQEVLYPVLEDNRLYSHLNSTVQLEINPLTILGATTNQGRLERPFIDRFGFQFQLDYYTHDELSEILFNSAEKLKMKITWDGVDEVAKRARGTPRIANNFLKRLRDYSDVLSVAAVDGPFANYIITSKLNTDIHGLRPLDYRYLKAVAGQENGIGVDVIATKLQEEVETVEDFIEPYLIRLGLVERRRNGRWLTTQGQKFLDDRGKSSSTRTTPLSLPISRMG